MSIIELCKLAVQAGIGRFWRVGPLARFAALVAEREREACAKLCEGIEDEAYKLWDAAADPHDQGRASGATECAAAIRARKLATGGAA